jgi:hypothetical protein
VSPQAILFRNLDGPSVQISIGDASLGNLSCGDQVSWVPTVPPPWHIVVKASDGSVFGAVDAAAKDLEVRIRSDGVVSGPSGGPLGPAPKPCE